MKYKVVLTPEGEEALLQAFEYIFERAPFNGMRWLRAFHRAADSLGFLPERCPFAPERMVLEENLRHLVFKSHRIVFRVDKAKKEVHIVDVRHGRRRAGGECEADDEDAE